MQGLKKIVGYLRDYVKLELKIGYLLSILTFLAVYIFIEYKYDIGSLFTFESSDIYSTGLIKYVTFLFPFLIGYLLYSFFYKDFTNWRKPLFWLLILGAPLIFSFRSLMPFFSEEFYARVPTGPTAFFYYRCVIVLCRDLVIFVPIFVYWFWADRNKMPLYGFTIKNYDAKPYLMLLLLMIPLVLTASFQGDFLSQYPKGFSLAPLTIENPDDRPYFFIYELFYGFDFVFIEFFFRGFLLLAFYRHFGWSCLMPMACFYVSIHFGKPLGETISSFFGGSILGILAIRTGSIAGGIIVHLGVAWLMEITALLHKII